MSTRGNIGIKENGKYTCIYNQYDSYIDGLGIILYQHYKDVNKVKELIALGDTSSVGATVEEGGSKSYREHLDKPISQRGTVSYFRDINRWKDCNEYYEWDKIKPFETENLEDVLEQSYTYIFDTDTNKWYVAYWNDNYTIRDLEKVLHSKELLEEIYSDSKADWYLNEFYERCLNA